MLNVNMKALKRVVYWWLAVASCLGLAALFVWLFSLYPLATGLFATFAFFCFISYVLYDVSKD